MQFVAIDKIKAGITEEELNPHLPKELAETVGLYLEEKIRNWYFRKDRPGVVFILEADSTEEVKETLGRLPLVQEGILDFDVIPVGPLEPLGLLVGRPMS